MLVQKIKYGIANDKYKRKEHDLFTSARVGSYEKSNRIGSTRYILCWYKIITGSKK